MFWSEIGSGLGESGGIPLPRIPRSTPPPPGYRHTRKKKIRVLPTGRRTYDLLIMAMPSNKAPGPDKISMRVNKDSLRYILPAIADIVNRLFFDVLHFSYGLETCRSRSTLKDGDHEEPRNNRPLSLLPPLSKVCEKAVLKQLVHHLLILLKHEYGELRGAGLAQCQSTRLPPMWPGFDSRTRRHMWAEFVDSLLCSERFFSGYSGFPLS